ncbi:MAG: undecaprenyldiphospho-muramoylpentapeptide beta-N-acetylglucosaminyltransferase [Actinomycetota bacterium]|nr:undecaprenyldiphospho-muramoylpentapeptide beta-N-acetylglucosaminyltransferase [Actinomycetota bacterium]
MKVAIAGGGTAGHVNPAIALARQLQKAGPAQTISFIGTATGAEATLVPGAGFELSAIDVLGFDRSKPMSFPATGARAGRAIKQARSALTDSGADVVVGMGGYVSLPVCVAARSLRRPVVLHEQNIVLGLANKVVRPWARAVAVSWAETMRQAGRRAVLTGNPVAGELVGFDAAEVRARAIARWDLDPARKTLLVFGGSQGARRINEAAAGLARLWKGETDRQVVHVAGSPAYGAVKEEVEQHLNPNGALIYRAIDYLHGMLEAYAVADLALCRGGASTVAELTAVGLPAIIVPYPHHRDRQQERHARVLEDAGAAVLLPDAETTTYRVAGEVERLLTDPAALVSMGVESAQLGHPDAAGRLARLVVASAP